MVKVDQNLKNKKVSEFKSFCFAVSLDLAKFRHFGKSLQVFVKIMTVYFLFGKMLSLLWQICDVVGLIFRVLNGQILKKSNHLVTLPFCFDWTRKQCQSWSNWAEAVANAEHKKTFYLTWWRRDFWSDDVSPLDILHLKAHSHVLQHCVNSAVDYVNAEIKNFPSLCGNATFHCGIHASVNETLLLTTETIFTWNYYHTALHRLDIMCVFK